MREGYGWEDVAVRLGIGPNAVRAFAAELARRGLLAAVYRGGA